MKTLLVGLAVAFSAAGALADVGGAKDPSAPKSRSEVRSETDGARADGTLNRGSEQTMFYDRFTSPKTRAQVRDEILRARADGTLFRGSEETLFPEENKRAMGSGTSGSGKR